MTVVVIILFLLCLAIWFTYIQTYVGGEGENWILLTVRCTLIYYP